MTINNENFNQFFLINRRLFNNPLWNILPFSEGQAWIDLIGKANYITTYMKIRGNIIKVERGQSARSILTLSKDWGWSRSKVETFLNLLQKEQQISIKKTNLTTIISICNYNNYQFDSNKNSNRTYNRHQTDEQQTRNRHETDEQQTETSKESINNNILNNNKEKNIVKDFGSSSAKYPRKISEILNIEISDFNSDVNLDEEKQIDIKFWNQFADKNNLQKINGLDINQSFIQIYTELKLRKADKFDIKTAIQQIEKSNLLKPDYKYKPQNLNFYWLFKKDDNGILNYDNLITESKHFGNIDSYNQNATVKVEEDEHTKYIRRRKEWSILSILDKYKFEEIKLHIPKINNENDFEEIDYVNITSNLTKFSVSTEEKKQIILELLKLYPNEPIYKKWYEWTDYYFYTQKNKGCCQFENSKYKSEGKN